MNRRIVALVIFLLCIIFSLCVSHLFGRKYSEEELLSMPPDDLYELLLKNGLEVPDTWSKTQIIRSISAHLPETIQRVKKPIYIEGEECEACPGINDPDAIFLTASMYRTLKKIMKR